MKDKDHFIEKDRPTDSPYSYPFVVSIFKTSEKHGLFRFFRKVPHFVTRFFSFLAGSFLLRFGPWRKLVSKNLDIIFKGKIKEKYGKRMYRKIVNSISFMNTKSLARNFIENLFTLTSLTVYEDYYKNVIKWEGESLNRIIDAWKLGKGVVLISIHAGCPEILTTALGYFRRGGDIPAKAKASIPTEKGSVDAYINYMNRVVGMLEIEQEEGVDRKGVAVDVIKRSQILMLAIDRGHKNYPMLPLFGKQGRTPIGPAYMNVKYGSPILPAYIVPHPKKSQW
ncbi:MAG: LpxL/LpxP family acyltransferase, partial [Candidatus Helarchaeota archaeon]